MKYNESLCNKIEHYDIFVDIKIMTMVAVVVSVWFDCSVSLKIDCLFAQRKRVYINWIESGTVLLSG